MITIPSGVDWGKLDTDLQANQKYQRWEQSATKQGYSGLVWVDLGNGTCQLLVMWTDDGINGYPRTLTAQQERTIQRYMDSWVQANPPIGG